MSHRYNVFKKPPNVPLPEVIIPNPIKRIFKNDLQPFENMTEFEERYLKLMQKLAKTVKLDRMECHLEILKLLLYVEQFYVEESIKAHRLSKQKPKPDSEKNVFQITVPELDQDDPFVTLGDFVLLDQNVLRITEIKSGMLKAKALNSTSWFSQNKCYNVSFKLNNYTMRCHHYAIEKMIKFTKNKELLYPQSRNFNQKIETESQWFNLEIKRNREQTEAIRNIIHKTARPAPYILFGPPGTGKTAVLVEAILQIYNSDPSNRILICTPSNTAADEITKRLLKHICTSDILRFYSPSRDTSLIDDEILPCSNVINGSGFHIPKEIIITKNVLISTLTNCIRLLALQLPSSYFSYIFIDEAGQATEPESLIPLVLLCDNSKRQIQTQIVLSGDPLQLGPVVKSKHVGHLLGMSILERLMALKLYSKNGDNRYDPKYITKLVRNYRSHDAILRIPNELFYENELMACGGPEIRFGEDWEHLLNKKFPIIFHAINGHELKEEGSLSTYNVKEIEAILYYLDKLTAGRKKFDHKNIGVVTPFKLQEKRIKLHLKQRKISDVNVGTVQIFQGQEKDVIILSTVRSRLFQHNGETHIGFLSNTKRFNVSLTRAKSLLIVVGNPNVLKYDSTWKTFLTYCVQNNACFGEKFSLHESISDRKTYFKPAIVMPRLDDKSITKVDQNSHKKKSPVKINDNERCINNNNNIVAKEKIVCKNSFKTVMEKFRSMILQNH